MGPRSFVNPEIIWQSSETVRHSEGSVSMPGVTEEVERPARVRVSFQTLDGETREEEAEGLMAVCLQHEIDQLTHLLDSTAFQAEARTRRQAVREI